MAALIKVCTDGGINRLNSAVKEDSDRYGCIGLRSFFLIHGGALFPSIDSMHLINSIDF